MARGLKGRGVFSPVFVDVRDGADGLNGQNGRDGKDGAGVQSVQEQWYLSKSHTILDGGAWDSARPQMQPYTYLWRKSWQKLTNGTTLGERIEFVQSWREMYGDEMRDNVYAFSDAMQFAEADKGKANRVEAWSAADGSAIGRLELDYTTKGCRLVVTKAGAANIRYNNLRLVRDAYYTAQAVVSVRSASGAVRQLAATIDFCDSAVRAFTTSGGERVAVTGKAERYYDGQYTFTSGFFDIEIKGLAVGDVVTVQGVMIERGTELLTHKESRLDAAEWKRRLAAFNLDLSKITAGIEGGTVFGGMLQMMNAQGATTAYLCGLDGNNALGRAAIALGVSDFNTAGERAMVKLGHDGRGNVGKIRIDGGADGSTSMHIVNAQGVPMVELTDQPMEKGEVRAARTAVNHNFTAVWASGSLVVQAPQAAGVPTLARSETGAPYYITHDQISEVDSTGISLTITGAMQGGVGVGSFRCEIVPDAAERAKYTAASLMSDVAHIRLLDASGNQLSFATAYVGYVGAVDMAQFANLPASTYRLSVRFIARVGRPSLRITSQGAGYKVSPDASYTALAGDGLMAYLNRNQYTYIKEGVLNVKGQMQAQVVQATGRIDPTGAITFWHNGLGDAGREFKIVKINKGEYQVKHYLGHTDYAVVINPVDNETHAKCLIGQLGAQEKDYAWIFIRNILQAGAPLIEVPFTFAIVGLPRR